MIRILFSGSLLTKKYLDRESKDFYELKIKIQNQRDAGSCNLQVIDFSKDSED